MRWDFLNALTLCAGCHKWGHENPLAFTNWFKGKWKHRYDYLIEIRKDVRPVRTVEMTEWREKLKQKLKDLKEK